MSPERRRLGWLTPIVGTLPKEVIDCPVILNALRALGLVRNSERASLPANDAKALREEHMKVEAALGRLCDT